MLVYQNTPKSNYTMVKLATIIFVSLCALSVSSLYSSNDAVVQLNSSNFNSLVKNSDDIWLIEFYAPWCGHCKTLAPEYKKAAAALKGVVKIGAVDMTTDQGVGAPYNIQGFPTIKFFGANKGSPSDYNGQRTANAIVDFCMGKVRESVNQKLSGGKANTNTNNNSNTGSKKSGTGGSKLKDLTSSSFESEVISSKKPHLVMFYAPWCGHCKAAMPDFESAAGEVEKDVGFGRVDCTAEQSLCSDYGVQGYPTIKFFGGGKVEDYNGTRNKSDFIRFADSQAETVVPPKELAELVSQEKFEEYCVEHTGICLIAFLPHIKDSGEDKRKQLISELSEVRSKHSSKPLTFLWVQGGDNFDFEESLRLGSGFPTIIAINHTKGKFAPLRAKYNKEEINKFINDLLSGRAAVYDLKKDLPKIKKRKVKSTTTEEL